MKLPRDLSGIELAKLLRRYGYEITRQTGSHIRLTAFHEKRHHLTIPRHKSLKPGILNAILKDVANNLGKSKKEIIEELFG
jgi:predicted RNA binding protein YcfA (HicA-like mRNA interferase family)